MCLCVYRPSLSLPTSVQQGKGEGRKEGEKRKWRVLHARVHERVHRRIRRRKRNLLPIVRDLTEAQGRGQSSPAYLHRRKNYSGKRQGSGKRPPLQPPLISQGQVAPPSSPPPPQQPPSLTSSRSNSSTPPTCSRSNNSNTSRRTPQQQQRQSPTAPPSPLHLSPGGATATTRSRSTSSSTTNNSSNSRHLRHHTNCDLPRGSPINSNSSQDNSPTGVHSSSSSNLNSSPHCHKHNNNDCSMLISTSHDNSSREYDRNGKSAKPEVQPHSPSQSRPCAKREQKVDPRNLRLGSQVLPALPRRGISVRVRKGHRPPPPPKSTTAGHIIMPPEFVMG